MRAYLTRLDREDEQQHLRERENIRLNEIDARQVEERQQRAVERERERRNLLPNLQDGQLYAVRGPGAREFIRQYHEAAFRENGN